MYNREYTLLGAYLPDRRGLRTLVRSGVTTMQSNPPLPQPSAVYVHIPFCARRCAYCDFPTFAGRDHLIPTYLSALLRQIEASPHAGARVETVYFGGGTPTYVGANALRETLAAIRATFRVAHDAEVTVESNPSTLEAAGYAALRDAGFNRMSIGVQSFNDAVLRVLGRLHTADEARQAVRAAMSAGFANVSLDLMFGAPSQSRSLWQDDLAQAVDMGVQHISAYSLTVEKATPFALMQAAGRLSVASEDLAATMFEGAIDFLTGHGYGHYEISNYARAGFRCRHNMVYWQNLPYLGFGAAAAQYDGVTRTVAARDPQAFVGAVEDGVSVVVSSETLSRREALAETLMLGIRLRAGVSLGQISARFGEEAIPGLRRCLDTLQQRGLIVIAGDGFCLTRQGLMLADSVAVELMSEVDESLRADSNR